MKNFSDDELKNYLSKYPKSSLCIQCLPNRREGRSLFASIEGDKDTIMGLPVKKIKEYINIMMKKYFVIGNPINHSLSPKLHNYWLKNNIDAIYDKKN